MADMIRKKIPPSDQQIATAEETASGGPTVSGNSIRNPMPLLAHGPKDLRQDKTVTSSPMPASPERPVSTVKTKDDAYPVYKRGGSMSQSFNSAFGEARARGDKTFEWQGRQYGTEMAKPPKKIRPITAGEGSRLAP